MCSHGRRCIDGGNREVRVRIIQHSKYGTIRKIENTIWVLVAKQQPNLQIQGYNISPYYLWHCQCITVTTRPWKKHLEIRQACLKGLISKEYPLTRSDRCNKYSHWLALEIQTKLRWNVMKLTHFKPMFHFPTSHPLP